MLSITSLLIKKTPLSFCRAKKILSQQDSNQSPSTDGESYRCKGTFIGPLIFKSSPKTKTQRNKTEKIDHKH